MQNYFEQLGILEAYHLDAGLLKQRFMDRSRLLHPDFHTLESDEDQQESFMLSAGLNQAYKTLQKPDSRLEYLLTLHELLGSDGNTTTEKLSPAFLMEMMEMNEEVEQASEALNTNKLTELEQGLQSKLQDYGRRIDSAMQAFDGAEGSARPISLQKVLPLYLERKYLLRIRDSLLRFAPQS